MHIYYKDVNYCRPIMMYISHYEIQQSPPLGLERQDIIKVAWVYPHVKTVSIV